MLFRSVLKENIIDSKEREIQEYLDKLRKVEEKNKVLECANEDLAAKNKTTLLDYELLEHQVSTLKQTIDSKEIKKKDCKECLNRKEEKSDSKSCRKCKSYKDTLKTLEKKYNRDYQDMKTKYKEKIKRRDKEIAELKKPEEDSYEKIIDEEIKELDMKKISEEISQAKEAEKDKPKYDEKDKPKEAEKDRDPRKKKRDYADVGKWKSINQHKPRMNPYDQRPYSSHPGFFDPPYPPNTFYSQPQPRPFGSYYSSNSG